LANKYFPLGTGFATFGSALAAENYSPLYVSLGFNSLHGGSAADPRFLSDSFWPTVIAQTGWIGGLLFLGVVICLVVLVFRTPNRLQYVFWSMLTIVMYELIASSSESAFFNPTCGILMAVFGLMINICNKELTKGSIQTEVSTDCESANDLKESV
jgi:hypothetical protein